MALPIPEKLSMELVSKNIKMEDMLQLKEILDQLIFALTNKSES